jgi:prevent-host-death family protein
MRSRSISDAKNQLSALIKQVQGGEPITITDRGVPVARLVPIRVSGIPARALGLAQLGLATLPERAPHGKWLESQWPEIKPGPSAVDLLLEDRRKDR